VEEWIEGGRSNKRKGRKKSGTEGAGSSQEKGTQSKEKRKLLVGWTRKIKVET